MGTNLKIAWLSDFDLAGSGYKNVSVPLCRGLVERGHEILAIGLGYKGDQHDFPFGVLQARNLKEAEAMALNLQNMWGADVVVTALDIPMQELIMNSPYLRQRKLKYIGIFPVESDPICISWAMVLMQMDRQLVISRFGTNEARKVGVPADYVQIGIDIDAWPVPTEDQKLSLRGAFGFAKDDFVILTVADNQERKNLAIALEAFGEFAKDKPDARYVLVTREHNPIGWKLRDLGQEYGINDKLMIFERGMSHSDLWTTYAVSDVFLMASKAEGLCTLPDTNIWMLNGKKKISDISVGDLVISHTGNLRGVNQVHKRHYSGDMFEVIPSYGLSSLKLTPDHRVLSAKRNKRGQGISRLDSIGWFPVSSLKVGDYIFYPKQNFVQEKILDLTNYLSSNEYFIHKDKIGSLGKNQYGDEYNHPVSKLLPKQLMMSKELMRLIGYYISEGCQTNDGLSFSFHSDELDLQQEVSLSMKSLFNLDVKVTYRDRHRCQMWVYHSLLGRFFGNLCGKSSHYKKLPDWVLWLPNDLLLELLRALFLGDGTYSKRGQRTMRYSTVSKELAEQIQFILTRFGVMSGLQSGKNRIEYTVSIRHPDLYKLSFYRELLPEITKLSSKRVDFSNDLLNGFFIPIKYISVFEYDGDVYNLDVEEDQSYLTTGGIVHNCMPILEAMAIGLPSIGTNCTGMKELLSDGRGYLVDYVYIHRDPFGNGKRYWIDKQGIIDALNHLYYKNNEEDIAFTKANARQFVTARTWQVAVDQVEKVLLETCK